MLELPVLCTAQYQYLVCRASHPSSHRHWMCQRPRRRRSSAHPRRLTGRAPGSATQGNVQNGAAIAATHSTGYIHRPRAGSGTDALSATLPAIYFKSYTFTHMSDCTAAKSSACTQDKKLYRTAVAILSDQIYILSKLQRPTGIAMLQSPSLRQRITSRVTVIMGCAAFTRSFLGSWS